MSITNLSLSLLFSNLIGLFSLIGVGFLLVRTKLIPVSASGPMTTLLMKITLPATIFSSMIRPFDLGFLQDALVIFVVGFLFHLGYGGMSWLLSRLFRVPKGRRGMWMQCCTFCNNGFMGYPVAYAIFGEEGLALAVMLGIAFNLLIYSLGAKMVAMDQPEGGQSPQLSWSKAVFSVVNLVIAVSLLIYCFQIPVPAAVLSPIQQLANITTPLSMLITGMNLAGSRLSEVIFDRDAVTASFVRLLAFPVITWALLRLLPISNPLVVGVMLLIMSMPSAAVSVAMGEQYNGCTELGARTVFLSSLLCIVTIPMISLLL